MDLWIRSQDKTQLYKVIGLYYEYQKEKHRITCITENDYYWIGIYETKERALEVLDEIQTFIEKQGTCEATSNEVGIINGIQVFGNVYQMPKE